LRIRPNVENDVDEKIFYYNLLLAISLSAFRHNLISKQFNIGQYRLLGPYKATCSTCDFSYDKEG